MPIYAYKCSSCGHAADVLQKMSDDALTDCPACGKSTYAKQLTAPGFQLKGSGWYVTDFKSGAPAAVPAVATEGGATKTGDSAPTAAPVPAKADAPASGAPAAASASSTTAAPAATPAASSKS